MKLVVRWDAEVNRYVAGSPELDVWSSGESEEEARERAKEAVSLFLEEVAAHGTGGDLRASPAK